MFLPQEHSSIWRPFACRMKLKSNGQMWRVEFIFEASQTFRCYPAVHSVATLKGPQHLVQPCCAQHLRDLRAQIGTKYFKRQRPWIDGWIPKFHTVREAPFKFMSQAFGHCRNKFCTSPPRTQTGTLGHFFPGRFERLCQITVLRVYKCHKES